MRFDEELKRFWMPTMTANAMNRSSSHAFRFSSARRCRRLEREREKQRQKLLLGRECKGFWRVFRWERCGQQNMRFNKKIAAKIFLKMQYKVSFFHNSLWLQVRKFRFLTPFNPNYQIWIFFLFDALSHPSFHYRLSLFPGHEPHTCLL